MRKAQIASQIFIYIIAVVVVGLIIAYGYSAIKSFSEKGEQVEYITLKSNIENAVKSLTSDYGSVKRPDIGISGKYDAVCFVNKDRGREKANTSALCQEFDDQKEYFQPVACEGWKLERDNVFLIPDGSESFYAGEMVIAKNEDFLCIDVINNRINLQLKGLGDKVEVSNYTR
ncbi:hypothetical protein ACFL3V_07095 [Nanoarchaeota archaeon]